MFLRVLTPLCFLGFLMSLGGPTRTDDLSRSADLVLLNARVWTGEAGPGRFAEAVAMARGRILAVGRNGEIRNLVGGETQVIDLGGRWVVPGFIDSHVHFVFGGLQTLQVNLKDAHDETEFARRVAERARALPPGRWILGGSWDEQNWPGAKLPTRALVDPVTPQHPVYLTRYDGHSALANSLALKLANVTRDTADPSGGVIVRDATGEPTGVLKDAAMGLVEKAVPRPSEAEMEDALRAALLEAARVGVTSVHNIAMDSDSWNGSFLGEIDLLGRAEREGWLTTRFYEMAPLARWTQLEENGLGRAARSDFVRVAALKDFTDGSLGSATAWMYEPFENQPGNRGLPMPPMDPPERMEAWVRGADRAGLQVCLHAIGDRAVAETLDLFTRVGGEGAPARRFRVEHAQHVRPEDFARFASLGVIASMQPYHAIDDGRWAEAFLGRRRARSSYAWRSVLAAGAPLAFGSDWPVAPLDPLLGIYAAVTRATLDGKNPGGWVPEERISVEAALRAYTSGSAYAGFEEEQKGTLSPGKLADLVVLSEDLFQIPPEEIRDVRVVMTVVGGRIVHRKI